MFSNKTPMDMEVYYGPPVLEIPLSKMGGVGGESKLGTPAQWHSVVHIYTDFTYQIQTPSLLYST